MKQIQPYEVKTVRGLPPIATKKDRVAIDTEWFGMKKTKLHRPTGKFASLACTFDGHEVFIITDEKQVPEFLKRLDQAVWVFHNSKFDIFHLRRLAEIKKRMRLWDTMIVDQIMWSGYYTSFSLADLARRWLGLYVPKEERESFLTEEVGHMTDEMEHYAAVDVIATWKVYKAQRGAIDENDLSVWKNIDLPALWTILSMSGMMLNVDAWKSLAEKNRSRAEIVAKKYPDIKLSSWRQVLDQMHKLGYKKLKSTKEDFMRPYVEECEFAADVLEWRGLAKADSTYGENWLEGIVEDDGRVYSDFSVNGASTGRLSSSNPNVENIPSKDTNEFRECFIAAKGNVLISADWSSQEPRIAAYLSNDKSLTQIFQLKKDVYIESARLMFGWKLDKKDPRRKKRMKPTVLGASYGLTKFGLQNKYGIPLDEGEELLDKFFNTFTGMKKWKASQQKIRTFVTTIYGRKFWLNPYIYGSENNAINSPVQGSAADALKIAAYRFLMKWGWTDTNSILVNCIHDEILLEVPVDLKDAAMNLLKEVMIQVAEEMHDGIPADVEVHASSNWGEAKE